MANIFSFLFFICLLLPASSSPRLLFKTPTINSTSRRRPSEESLRDLTPEERLKLNRERNRDHSRRSRERKKAYVEGLKKQVRVVKTSAALSALTSPPPPSTREDLLYSIKVWWRRSQSTAMGCVSNEDYPVSRTEALSGFCALKLYAPGAAIFPGCNLFLHPPWSLPVVPP